MDNFTFIFTKCAQEKVCCHFSKKNPWIPQTFVTSLHELRDVIAKNICSCAWSNVCTASLNFLSSANWRPRNAFLICPKNVVIRRNEFWIVGWVREKLIFQISATFSCCQLLYEVDSFVMQSNSSCQHSLPLSKCSFQCLRKVALNIS